MRLVIVGDGGLASQIAAVAMATATNLVEMLPSSTLSGAESRSDARRVLAAADWVFEVGGLELPAKRALLQELSWAAAPGAVISTDESVVPMRELLEGVDDPGRVFAVTHVFAPPARMRLAEVVASTTEFERVATLCEAGLGRKVMRVPDAPGFIANRMGFFWLALVISEAGRLGLAPAEADAVAIAVTGAPVGAFALADLIGLDVLLLLDAQLRMRLPQDDALHGAAVANHPTLRHLVDAGALGRASGAGFYRRGEDGRREAIDPSSLAYLPVSARPGYASSELLRILTARLDGYALRLAATTRTPLAVIAEIMSLGYGWTCGSRWREPA